MGGTSLAPIYACGVAVAVVGVIGPPWVATPPAPPLICQAPLVVRAIKPVGIGISDLISLTSRLTSVPVIASLACTGLDTSKLYGPPTLLAQNVATKSPPPLA